MIDTDLDWDEWYIPHPRADTSIQASIERFNYFAKFRSIVVLKRKFYERIMYTPIGIGKINPADCQRFVLPLSILQDASKLEVMLRTAWRGCDEHFLNRFVEILISDHVVEPPVAENCGKQLTNA